MSSFYNKALRLSMFFSKTECQNIHFLFELTVYLPKIQLYIEKEVNNVAVLHNILLALGADKTLFSCGGK